MVAVLENIKPLALFDEERDILKPRARPAFIDWMENNYILEGGTSAIEGPWTREYTPYFAQVAEWLSDTTTREIWVTACSQAGKSTVGTGFVGYITDCAPGPTLLIMPTKDDVHNRVEARIRPMFKANEDLLRHVGGRERNVFIGKQTVMDHMILYIGWPTTAQALADKPVCYIIADEVCKYPATVGAEADPISLMRKRQRWFKGRSKLLAMTTPVTQDDMGDQEWKRGDCCQWWVPCGHCNKWHQIDWENVLIDKKTDGKFYHEARYKSGNLSRYVCPKCGTFWTEDDRWKAVTKGKFVPGDCHLDDNGEIVGKVHNTSYRSCRIHALMLHPMVESITSLTSEFVHAIDSREAGNIEPYKDFRNSQLARPWRETKAETDIERLRKHIGNYPMAMVPAGVQMLTCGADVQLDHVYIRVIGWGYMGEFWSIFEQRIETGPTDRVENLEKIVPFLMRRFDLMYDEKTVMRIALTGIDRSYNTETVDALCVKYAGSVPIIPVMGDDNLKKQAYRVGKAAGTVLKRYDLNVTMYKDALYRSYFEASKSGSGFGHLHKDTEFIVLQHLTSEHKDIIRTGTRIKWIGWMLKKEGLENHYWDCDVYARAAADIAGLWSLTDPDKTKKEITYEGRHPKIKKIRTKY